MSPIFSVKWETFVRVARIKQAKREAASERLTEYWTLAGVGLLQDSAPGYGDAKSKGLERRVPLRNQNINSNLVLIINN